MTHTKFSSPLLLESTLTRRFGCVSLVVMCNVMGQAAIVLAIILGFQQVSSGTEKSTPVSASDQAIRDSMVKMARQLGVTCNACHDVKNFKDGSMEKFKIAKEHMKVVELINTQGFTSKKAPKADCFMCHRGKSIPDYKEPR